MGESEIHAYSQPLRDLIESVNNLRKTILNQGTRQVQSLKIKEEVRAVVQTYFRIVRPLLGKISIDTKQTDARMQRLLELSNRDSSQTLYKNLLRSLVSDLAQVEMCAELQISNQAINGPRQTTSPVEHRIISTLADLIPSTAISYNQVLLDLEDKTRISFRGTATELREILRETLDYLAPDKEVEVSSGFKFEEGRDKPTMKQKTKYILRSRGKTKTSIEVPVQAIEIVEQTVSSLVRSTYDRGSVDTHTSSGISKPAVKQLKMYVDSVLCELLEIHQKV